MKREMVKIALVVLVVFAGITACKKEEKTDDLNSSEDVMQTEVSEGDYEREELYASIGCNVDWSTVVGTCATITQSSVEYPKIVTIDFGTGCTDKHGRVKKGKIIVTVTDDIRNPSAVRTVTFENFYVNDVQITGERKASNNGISADGFILIKVQGNLAATNSEGTRTRTFERQREWIAGSETCEISDDEFKVTGSGTTTNRKGVVRTHTITEAIHIKPGSCKYPLSGKVDIDNGKRGGILDFGSGDCDNTATLTTKKRNKVYTINLDDRKIVR